MIVMQLVLYLLCRSATVPADRTVHNPTYGLKESPKPATKHCTPTFETNESLLAVFEDRTLHNPTYGLKESPKRTNAAPTDTYEEITLPGEQTDSPVKAPDPDAHQTQKESVYYAYALCSENADESNVSAYAVRNIGLSDASTSAQPTEHTKSKSVSLVPDGHPKGPSKRSRASSARAPKIPMKPAFLHSSSSSRLMKKANKKKQSANKTVQNSHNSSEDSHSGRPVFRRSRSARAPRVPVKPKKKSRIRNTAPTSRSVREDVKPNTGQNTAAGSPDYSSLNPKSQYAILEPFTGIEQDGKLAGTATKADEYSHLNH